MEQGEFQVWKMDEWSS